LSEALKVRLPRVLKEVRVLGSVSPTYGSLPNLDAAETVDLDGELESAREEAFQHGYEKAASEWAARLDGVLLSLDKEASLLSDCRKEFLESLERSVVDLGIAVAEKFLISERERRRYSISAIVRTLLDKVEDKGQKITIALNPADMEPISTEGVTVKDGPFKAIKLVGDPAVPLAGCRLESGMGSVAVGLEEQMKEIRKLLMEMEVPEDDGRGD
jgi:flagellar biosynthesis/type III secretory pathway protein FliH